MAYNQENGTASLRAEVVDKSIKQIAEAQYKFKPVLTISSLSAWKSTFFREASGALTAPAGNAFKQIPRGAAFPQVRPTWEEVSSRVEKYGAEDNVFYEDELTNDIDVIARTLYKITEAITKAVDDAIWNVLTENETPSSIQTVLIAQTKHWNGASAAIINDIMTARQKIAIYNYDSSNVTLFVSPQGHTDLVTYLAARGAQFPTIGESMATNGRVGKVAGADIVVSNSVAASWALMVVNKIAATWREVEPLKTETTRDPFKSTRIRASCMGVCQLTDPLAVVAIRNTYQTTG